MNRRELLLGGIALAGAAAVKGAHAAEHNHSMMDHGSMHANRPYAALAAASADCLQTGQTCLSHCLVLLGEGDKKMAECARSVSEILAICGALQQLANQNSKQTARFARVAMDACKQCEDECRKHADKHEECKACGESCAACYRECKKIAA